MLLYVFQDSAVIVNVEIMTHFDCLLSQTCMDFKCVNASVLLPNLKCDAQTTCNGRGVSQHLLDLFFFTLLPANNDMSDFAVNFFFRYVMTKGTATVETGGPRQTVTSQGVVAA